MDHLLPEFAAPCRNATARGWFNAFQLYIGHGDEILADLVVPDRAQQNGICARSMFPLLCAGKPLVALSLLELLSQCGKSVDTSVREFFPEIDVSDRICVWHLLSHSSGFRTPSAGARPWNLPTVAVALSGLAAIDEVAVGSDQYEPVYTWLVLAEIIRRLAGLATIRETLEYLSNLQNEMTFECSPKRIREGMAAGDFAEILVREKSGESRPLRDFRRSESRRYMDLGYQTFFDRDVPSPGTGLVASARALGRFYDRVRSIPRENLSRDMERFLGIYEPAGGGSGEMNSAEGRWGCGLIRDASIFGFKWHGHLVRGYSGLMRACGVVDMDRDLTVVLTTDTIYENRALGQARFSHVFDEVLLGVQAGIDSERTAAG